MVQLSSNHHYVPQWYQRRFLADGGGELFVLDKFPLSYKLCSDGKRRPVKRRAITKSGTQRLFAENGLYSIRLAGVREDAIERMVFGKIDDLGARAVSVFALWPKANGFIAEENEVFLNVAGDPNRHMGNILEFMDAQNSRTPRGIAQIRTAIAKDDIRSLNQNIVIGILMRLRAFRCTIWSEAHWEIFSIKEADQYFLLSDDPVTI